MKSKCLFMSLIMFFSMTIICCSCSNSNSQELKLEDIIYQLDSSVTKEQIVELMQSEPDHMDSDNRLTYYNKKIWNLSSNEISFKFENNKLKAIFIFLYETDIIDTELVYTDLQLQYGTSELKTMDNGSKFTHWIINDNKDTVTYGRNEDGSSGSVSYIYFTNKNH